MHQLKNFLVATGIWAAIMAGVIGYHARADGGDHASGLVYEFGLSESP